MTKKQKTKMGKRLYRVEVKTEVLVLADDEFSAELDAESFARDEYQWEVFAQEVKSEHEITDEWAESLVYHDGDDDITALEALEISQATLRAEQAGQDERNEEVLG